MKRRKFAVWTGNVVVTLCGGWFLNEFLGTLPFNMPYPVDLGIRWFLNVIGHNELANPDDMEILAFFLYLFGSVTFVGLCVFIVNRVILKQCVR